MVGKKKAGSRQPTQGDRLRDLEEKIKEFRVNTENSIGEFKTQSKETNRTLNSILLAVTSKGGIDMGFLVAWRHREEGGYPWVRLWGMLGEGDFHPYVLKALGEEKDSLHGAPGNLFVDEHTLLGVNESGNGRELIDRYGFHDRRGRGRGFHHTNFGTRFRNDDYQGEPGLGHARYAPQKQILKLMSPSLMVRHGDGFIDWLNRVDQVLAFKRSGDPRAVTLMEMKLAGYALFWWEGVQQLRITVGGDYITDWDTMRRELMARFIPGNYEEENFAKLQNLCRTRNQSVHDYSSDFYLFSSRVVLSDIEAQSISRFMLGLTKRLQDEWTLFTCQFFFRSCGNGQTSRNKVKTNSLQFLFGSNNRNMVTQIGNQNPFLRRLFSVLKPSKDFSFVVSYLINTCGLSPQAAISASKIINFKTTTKPDSKIINFKTTTKPDSNLQFFQDHGFTKPQISNLIAKFPKLLLANKENILYPKFEFLKKIGFSDPQVLKYISSNPAFLTSSLKAKIIPSFDYLKTFLITDENVTSTMKKSHMDSQFQSPEEKKLKSGLYFFINKLDLEPSYLVKYASLLTYSMETRIIPRWTVLQGLRSKGLLIKNKVNIGCSLKVSDSSFVKLYLIKYEKEALELLNVYKKVSFQIS
ncbi:hypothetical protein GIB67_005959 [Kingdonia uniflora]|uniref:Retrotransposon gag domain-containing protein n=1 Tax=Kingdonia uniflora TaxID=39325 RepID=A0A7J7MBN9_9MAGN|nr:hypothetical protein GIB67_005959 [Kingdonia uniflora]